MATFVAVPMRTMLSTVPTPGRSPSGYQAARIGMPSTMLTVPSWTPSCLAMPWWKTSHGPRPMSASAMNAMPMPNRRSPAMSPGSRGSTTDGAQRDAG